MRIFAAFALVAALALPPAASANSKGDCDTISLVAELVMKSHQVGVPMTDIMGNLGEHFSEIIIAAYDTPRFQTQAQKDRSVAEFRDKMTVACYKGEISVPDGAKP
ncbi:hypothetical protein [Pseudogemmobacter faecipullorum]|uniref:Uncharacterized protein n=1 Tax=Pseudogemmobacter faecipullorum TaxID=2755041 RepID=A0ABS8CQX9_9RHOB|nr:hypothetical protein [Pseudogemmobacter faecipullorum]MCB5411776.1 hypothetical protein [Pseudogemmobacter faecipullorum]